MAAKRRRISAGAEGLTSIFDVADRSAELFEPGTPVGEAWQRTFSVSMREAHIRVTNGFRPRALQMFKPPTLSPTDDGTVNTLEQQRVCTVRNRSTRDNTVWNEVRAAYGRSLSSGKKPGIGVVTPPRAVSEADCDFCHLSKRTAEDPAVPEEGRLELGCIRTCSNVAKFAPYHSCAVFNEHAPLEAVRHAGDLFCLAGTWLTHCRHRAEMRGEPLVRLLLGWNCYKVSGASLEHGHAQLLGVDEVPQWAEDLQREGGQAVADMIAVAERTGTLLAPAADCVAFPSLTPMLDMETFVVAPAPADGGGPLGRSAGEGVAAVLGALRQMGTSTFNVVATAIPAKASGIAGPGGSVCIVRLGDRGPYDSQGRMGFMEAMRIGGVGGTDPVLFASKLRELLGDN
eukprot:Hpha_TRINITY_DN2947_c0_g1::TRINITY_DN2947_c0_g1_i1::g.19755::m.19755